MTTYTRRPSGSTLPVASQRINPSGQPLPDGLYLARVLSNEDNTYTGRVQVQIADFDSDAPVTALMTTPMGGASNPQDAGGNVEDSSSTVNTFGMWMQPPSVGTTVLVQYSASLRQPVIVGGLISAPTNHNMGGNASGETYNDELGPVGEQNPNETGNAQTKPADPGRTNQLVDQGLGADHVRGHSMSSARRETPSRVMGITTPGGAVLTMDDGAADGSGSQNIRIKSPGGGQILIDDSTGIIFITNQSGSTHIEMNAEGNIDIFSENSISIGTPEDINFHAQGAINMHAEQGINMQSDTTIKMKSADDTSIKATNIKMSTSGNIYQNSPTAADEPEAGGLPENSGVTSSIGGRVPERHPWNGVPGVQESFTTGQGKNV